MAARIMPGGGSSKKKLYIVKNGVAMYPTSAYSYPGYNAPRIVDADTNFTVYASNHQAGNVMFHLLIDSTKWFKLFAEGTTVNNDNARLITDEYLTTWSDFTNKCPIPNTATEKEFKCVVGVGNYYTQNTQNYPGINIGCTGGSSMPENHVTVKNMWLEEY